MARTRGKSGFKLRSAQGGDNRTTFKSIGSSDAPSPLPKNRTDAAREWNYYKNMDRDNRYQDSNPARSGSKHGLYQGDYIQNWNQDVEGDIPPPEVYYDWDGDGEVTQREIDKTIKKKGSYKQAVKDLNNSLYSNTRDFDVSKPYLTPKMKARGYSQVQDPYGTWHIMGKDGQLKDYGTRAMDERSKAWREGNVWNPNVDADEDGYAEGSYVPYEKGYDFSVDQNATATEIKNRHTEQGQGQPIYNHEFSTVNPEDVPVSTMEEGWNRPKVVEGEPPVEKPPVEKPPVEDAPPVVEEDPPVEEDAGNFGDAFKNAREEGLKEFEWNGQKYHTRRADETPEEWNEKFGGGDINETPGALKGPQPEVPQTQMSTEQLEEKMYGTGPGGGSAGPQTQMENPGPTGDGELDMDSDDDGIPTGIDATPEGDDGPDFSTPRDEEEEE